MCGIAGLFRPKADRPADALAAAAERMQTGRTLAESSGARRGRLLFLVNNPRYFLSHRLQHALAARAAGFEVWVATPEDTASQEIEVCGFSFHSFTMNRWGSNPWQELKTVVSIFRLLRAVRPQILHTVTVKPVLYGGVAARLAGVPAVVAAIPGMGQLFSTSGWWAAARRFVVRKGYRLAFGKRNVRVIVQNPDDLIELVGSGVIDPARVVLIRGVGVDLSTFYPSPLPRGLPVVVCIARMLEGKGIREFVDAAQRLRKEGVAARFVLVGQGEEGNPSTISHEQLIAWHRTGVIEWWGHREDVPAVLAQATLVCLPSYREGLPKVLLEAAAAARPIVTTDVPGCREVVRDGENGFVVPPGDSARLADAIAGVLRDPALARAMGARSRLLAEREFGIEKVVQRTLNTYDKLVPPVVGEPMTPAAEVQTAPAPASVAREPTRALSSVRPAGAVTLSR